MEDKTKLPLVSVLIRSIGRNSLSEALQSVSLQTYPNIEVIIVNAKGNNHPPTGEWCGNYPIRLCGTGTAMKRSQAANCALVEAIGDYLIFLDDDDLYLPNHISGLVECIEKSEDKVVYSSVECIYGDDSQIIGDPYNRNRLMAGNYIPLHSLLFCRSFVEQGCRFHEGLDVCEDWDFWLQLSQKSNFTHLDQISAIYKCSGESGVGPGEELVNKKLIREAREEIINKWMKNWTARDINEMLRQHEIQAENRIRKDLKNVIADLETKIKTLKNEE